MKNSEDLSDVVRSLQQVLEQLDELEINIAAIKVAEALEILSAKNDATDQ